MAPEAKGADAGSRVGVADRMRQPGRVALDAVAASWTIRGERNGTAHPRGCLPVTPLDLRFPAGGPARAGRASPQAEPGSRAAAPCLSTAQLGSGSLLRGGRTMLSIWMQTSLMEVGEGRSGRPES